MLARAWRSYWLLVAALTILCFTSVALDLLLALFGYPPLSVRPTR